MPVSRNSFLLVLSQCLLITYLIVSGPLYPGFNGWLALLLLGAIIAVLATIAFQQSKLSVFPEPRQNAVLLTNGVYAYIRHPYYTSVLCITGAWVGNVSTPYRLAAYAALWFILLFKIAFEEKLLEKRFPQYRAYRQKTKRLIPFIV